MFEFSTPSTLTIISVSTISSVSPSASIISGVGIWVAIVSVPALGVSFSFRFGFGLSLGNCVYYSSTVGIVSGNSVGGVSDGRYCVGDGSMCVSIVVGIDSAVSIRMSIGDNWRFWLCCFFYFCHFFCFSRFDNRESVP